MPEDALMLYNAEGFLGEQIPSTIPLKRLGLEEKPTVQQPSQPKSQKYLSNMMKRYYDKEIGWFDKGRFVKDAWKRANKGYDPEKRVQEWKETWPLLFDKTFKGVLTWKDFHKRNVLQDAHWQKKKLEDAAIQQARLDADQANRLKQFNMEVADFDYDVDQFKATMKARAAVKAAEERAKPKAKAVDIFDKKTMEYKRTITVEPGDTAIYGKGETTRPLTPSAKIVQKKLDAWDALERGEATKAQKKLIGTDKKPTPDEAREKLIKLKTGLAKLEAIGVVDESPGDNKIDAMLTKMGYDTKTKAKMAPEAIEEIAQLYRERIEYFEQFLPEDLKDIVPDVMTRSVQDTADIPKRDPGESIADYLFRIR